MASRRQSGKAGSPGGRRPWEMSDYERQRTPQQTLRDESKVYVSTSVSSELMCPICHDFLQQTMVTKECLHRFCAECIITALRCGKKECPLCRTRLVSKRSLRPDPNCDLLIKRILSAGGANASEKDQEVDQGSDDSDPIPSKTMRLDHSLSHGGLLPGTSKDLQPKVDKEHLQNEDSDVEVD